jgi:integrase/recombinase XerD
VIGRAGSTALGERADSYLALRRSLGHRLEAPERLLHGFTSWLDGQPDPRLTTSAVLRWATDPAQVRGTLSVSRIAYRVSVVRSFATYLTAFDPTVEVPPRGLVRPEVRRSAPYLFTPEEVSRLMHAAAALPGPLWSVTMSTLIGLMSATGLRTSEAFRLDTSDHDPIGRTLLVRHSKNGRSRLLPLHPSTSDALGDYREQRDQLHRPRAEGSPALLLSGRGQRLGEHVPVGATFRRLLAETGIAAPGGRRPPRLHDLRHGFAVATLRGWQLDGQPVQPRLPALSDYLGHVNPHHTYWYLQAVPDLMGPIVDKLEAYLDDTAPGSTPGDAEQARS